MSNSKTITLTKGIPLGVYLNYITLSRILNVVISFLVGQAFIFQTVNPFVVPYLVVQINRRKGSFITSLISAFCGVVVSLSSIIDVGDFLGMPYFQAYVTQYTVAIIILFCSRLIFDKSKIRFSRNVKVFISGITTVASTVVILAFESFGTYYLILGLYTTLASIIIPMFIGEGVYILTLNVPKGKTKINDSELFSVALTMTIILIGATRVGFSGFSLFLVVLFLYILNLAYLFGGIVSGVITLVTVGLFGVLTTSVDANIVLFITFATVFAGFMRKEKKSVVLSFGTVIAVAFFLNKELFFEYNILTITISYLFGSTLFQVSPTKFFREVATFDEPVSNITDDIEIKDYENFTREFRVEKLAIQKSGTEKLEEIIKNLNFDYSCSCTECLSQKEKLRTFKNLMMQSNSIVKNNYNNLIEEFNSDIIFYKNLEMEILKSLVSKKVKYKDIKITKNQYDRYELVLFVNKYPLIKSEVEVLNNVLFQILNTKFIQLPSISQNDRHTKVYFAEKYDFNFSYGIAMKNKDGGKVSGDSYSILDLENHKNIIAISDGMGAGEGAKSVSSRTLDLLDDLVVADVGVDEAIKIVNSVMVINSKDEDFATLDIFEINKYTGECNVYKVGAAQTYILRNKKVKTISSDSLPIGIIEQVDVKKFKFKVHMGDYIIMVTDGISEIDRELIDKDKWLIETLQETNLRQPQDLADYILSKAEKFEDNFSDDRTIVVCKVW